MGEPDAQPVVEKSGVLEQGLPRPETRDPGGRASLRPTQGERHASRGGRRRAAGLGEPQPHGGAKETTALEPWAARCPRGFSFSPPVRLRKDQHQSPPLASPSNPSSSSPFFSPVPQGRGMRKAMARVSQCSFPLHSSPSITANKAEGPARGREENQRHGCWQPSKGLLTIVSSPEAFISNP